MLSSRVTSAHSNCRTQVTHDDRPAIIPYVFNRSKKMLIGIKGAQRYVLSCNRSCCYRSCPEVLENALSTRCRTRLPMASRVTATYSDISYNSRSFVALSVLDLISCLMIAIRAKFCFLNDKDLNLFCKLCSLLSHFTVRHSGGSSASSADRNATILRLMHLVMRSRTSCT